MATVNNMKKHDYDLIAVANTVQSYIQALARLWTQSQKSLDEAVEFYVKSELQRRNVNCQAAYVFRMKINVIGESYSDYIFGGMIAVIMDDEKAWSAKVSSETIGKISVEWVLL